LTFSGWDVDREANADKTIATFTQFIEDNKDTLEALSIIYNKTYKERPLTLEMVKGLYEALRQPPYVLSVDKLCTAYSIKQPSKVKIRNVVNQFADIISLLRFQLGQSTELNSFSADVARRFKEWTFNKQKGSFKFSQDQSEWLRLIRDHIAASIEVTALDLELSPFDSMGGLGRFYELFKDYEGGYENVLTEMNHTLMAA
jgi:type I restriction enzyme R subunit